MAADLVILGRPADPSAEIYPENSFAEVRDFCKWRYINTLSEYVEMNEGPEIWDFLREVWKAMQQSITDGLSTTGILPGGLNVERKAKQLYENQLPTEVAQVLECRIICAYAYAVSEQNADNGIIVTAPTCGAAGVLPSVLRYVQETRGCTEEQVLRALATAGILGNLAKRNASISGAECGCQAEVGVACAMPPAAWRALRPQPGSGGVRRRNRPGASPGPHLRPHLRPGPGPLHRTQRRGRHAGHERLQPELLPLRHPKYQLRHGLQSHVRNRPQPLPSVQRDLRRRPGPVL